LADNLKSPFFRSVTHLLNDPLAVKRAYGLGKISLVSKTNGVTFLNKVNVISYWHASVKIVYKLAI